MQKLQDFLINKLPIRNLEKAIFYGIFILALFGGAMLGFIAHSVQSKTDIAALDAFRPTLPTRVYDVNGRLVAELFREQRELVTLDEVPRQVVAAFLAVEDTNFYNHFGIDFMGILRAAWANLKAFRVVQGGSTITQQLVKGLYTRGEKTIFRKIYEAILALQVEKEYSKDEILEMYFNQTYFGHGAYGIASAAKFYFDRPVRQLNIMQGSVLAALPKAPHSYSPFRSPHVSYKKNRVILDRLVDLGYLTKEDSDRLYEEFWREYWKVVVVTPPSATMFGENRNKAPYFTEFIRQELIGLFGEDEVYSRGFQVYTTIDLDQQMIAEEIITKLVEKQDPIARQANKAQLGAVDGNLLGMYSALRNVLPLPGIVTKYSLRNDYRNKFKEENSDAFELVSLLLPVAPVNEASEEFLGSTREFKFDLKVQGAFLALEPQTGRITAMVGGREFKASDQFNRATSARRQPGSAFKPFVYGAALEDRAVHFAMGFLDSPLINIQPDGSTWAPANYEGGYMGYVHLNRALAASLNLVSVQVYDRVGPDKIIDFTSRVMKVPPSRFQPNPTLALGSSEVTPFELVLGMSIIGNRGRDVMPHGIIYITDREGNVLLHPERELIDALNYKQKRGQIQIIEEGVAWILRKMMEGVVRGGTAAQGIQLEGGFRGDGAGKTGTTSSWNDVWFSGFTSDLAAVIWMGMDNGSMTLGRHASGGGLAAPSWGEFMARVYQKRGKLPEPFDQTMPKGVRSGGVTLDTGKWPNPECPSKMVGTYIPEPIKVNGKLKSVGGERDDCKYVKTESILELLRKDEGFTKKELGNERGRFSGAY